MRSTIPLDWRAWYRTIINYLPKRKPKTTLNDEQLQQLEREFDAVSAQTIVSTADLANNIQRLNGRITPPQVIHEGVINTYPIIEEYSKIVMRSIEINKEVFQMAIGIKDDIKEVLRDRMDEFKRGRSKAWIVALNMSAILFFTLLWWLFQAWIATFLGGLPLP